MIPLNLTFGQKQRHFKNTEAGTSLTNAFDTEMARTDLKSCPSKSVFPRGRSSYTSSVLLSITLLLLPPCIILQAPERMNMKSM